MTSPSRTIVAVAAAIGLVAAGTSLYVHHQLLTEAGFSSFCDVNATVSCTEAYLSEYGHVGGVPVALPGAIYFALVLAVAAFGWRRPTGDPAAGYILALSVPALAFVGYLAFAAFFVLKALCILCAITYAAVVSIAVAAWRSAPPLSALAAHARRDLPRAATSVAAIAVVLVLIAGTAAVIRAFPADTRAAAAAPVASVDALPPVSDEERTKLAQWWDVQPKTVLPVDGGGAKVVVVKFNDYQCPPCRITHEAYEPLFRKHAGVVKFILKHYPLEGECNSTIQGGTHTAACEAAAAVIMARAKGTADAMEHWLFAHQGPPLLTPDQVREAARTVGGIQDFDAQYPTVLGEVRQDTALGNMVKVNATPTFFINNRRVPQILAPQYFNVLIEIEAQRP